MHKSLNMTSAVGPDRNHKPIVSYSHKRILKIRKHISTAYILVQRFLYLLRFSDNTATDRQKSGRRIICHVLTIGKNPIDFFRQFFVGKHTVKKDFKSIGLRITVLSVIVHPDRYSHKARYCHKIINIQCYSLYCAAYI